jgi:sterol desaturase/sphingolipid hydroxylase (fatty acid hydroxylase superfamily)
MEDQFEISNSNTPIRLFKSDFLEFFTHVHPITIIVIWVPFSLYMLYWAYSLHPAGTSLAYLPFGFLLGLFIWTFVEYNIHRFMFHFTPKKPWQERIVFLFHGIHHAQPRLKTRLVMPPPVSIPMSVFFVGLYYLVFGQLLGQPQWVGAIVCGFTVGYLAYDLIHYATHHFPMRWGYFKYLKRHHMLHHYRTPDQRFGVSSPFWDWVYGTLPVERTVGSRNSFVKYIPEKGQTSDMK